MREIYIGPIALEALVEFDTRAEDSACPFTFLAFPIELVGQHGVPTDQDAEAYIAGEDKWVRENKWVKKTNGSNPILFGPAVAPDEQSADFSCGGRSSHN